MYSALAVVSAALSFTVPTPAVSQARQAILKTYWPGTRVTHCIADPRHGRITCQDSEPILVCDGHGRHCAKSRIYGPDSVVFRSGKLHVLVGAGSVRVRV